MKLHLACGSKHLQGYKSVDIRPEVNPDFLADMRELDFLADGSADEIYCCHGIEHLSFADVPEALREWRTVLKPGGLLRLSLPDFEVMAKMYTDGVNLRTIRAAIMGGQDYSDNFHDSLWDFDTLAQALGAAGYRKISRYDARKFLPTGYNDWSVGKIAGYYVSLNVVATA